MATSLWQRATQSLLVMTLLLGLTGCGMNNIPTLDEQVKASWGQVENQYQRRADLVPNLVATVKGYASHEQETLKAVTDARARVGIPPSSRSLKRPRTSSPAPSPGLWWWSSAIRSSKQISSF